MYNEPLTDKELMQTREYLHAISDPNYAVNLRENVDFSGKLALFGGIAGFFFGVITGKSKLLCTCLGSFLLGGTAYIINNLKNENVWGEK